MAATIALRVEATESDSFGRRNEYLKLAAYPVTVDEAGQMHAASWYSIVNAGQLPAALGGKDPIGWPRYSVEGLEVTAQNDERHAAEGLSAYAWQLAHGGDVTAKNAAEVARILTGAERKLAALSERYGPAATFGAYLARVADVLGIRAAMVEGSSAYTTATGERWRQCTPAEAGAWLDDREAAYRKACAERITL
jgi:hypothetical protein